MTVGEWEVYTVELCSSDSKSNKNPTSTDLTFGPKTSFFLILYIDYNGFWQKRMKVIGPFKFVRAKFYCIAKLPLRSWG